ncbi:MAG: efflux RND transporter periplasmic adaptor subunit [Balneolales bacterium]
MKNSTCLLTVLLLSIGLLAGGCSDDHSHDENGDHPSESSASQENGHKHTEEGQQTDHEEEETIHLSGLQLRTAGIETGRLDSLPLNDAIKVNGTLELPPQNKANMSAVLGGLVQTIYVREGDQVNAGDVLAELVDPKFPEMQADYRKSASRIGYLEQEYERKERLLADNVGSQRDFQQAKSDYESAVAEMLSLESKLRMLELDPNRVRQGEMYDSVPLKSPIGGYVRVIETNIGQYADPNDELFEIVDNEHIHIDLLVYEKDIHNVKENQEVLFKYTNQPNDRFYKARIFSVGKAFEDNPRAVRVHAEIVDRQDGLLPGMFVEGRIITSTENQAALPEGAIVRDGADYLVFASSEQFGDHGREHAGDAETEQEFKAVKVRPGTTDAGYTQVDFFEPLHEGTQFVTKGAYYLLAEMKKGEGGHDH